MNPIENFLRIIHFDHPERIIADPPVFVVNYHGADHEGFDDDLGDNHPVGSEWTDIWGTVWHKIHPDVMGLTKHCPLEKLENLADYRFPDPNDERIYARIYRMAKDFTNGDLLLAGSHRDTLWEKAYMLVGMENMMAYFLIEPQFAREVLHRIMDFQLGIAEHYLKIGVRMVFLGDDLGTQQGPLLGPRIVNQFLVPEYRRLFQLYRERGILIGFHSCGCILSMLEPFMDLGVDILNPVQATANDLERVRSITRGRMALEGGVSSKTVMEGPVERITTEVRARLWTLGREGGYICQPDQGMPYPKEHLKAVYEAVERYGKYPIQRWSNSL